MLVQITQKNGLLFKLFVSRITFISKVQICFKKMATKKQPSVETPHTIVVLRYGCYSTAT